MKHVRLMLSFCLVLLAAICFLQTTAAAQCCQGIRGNVNNDVADIIDISDLVYFVDYSFGTPSGPAPECFEEADVDASLQLDVGDIVYLVAYAFTGGPAPHDCPVLEDDDIVYSDSYASGTTYEAFAGSLLEAVQETATDMYAGTSGLDVSIPGAEPWWSGGAFTDSTARDLTAYNALTFWAKATAAVTLDVAGIANDNTGTSKYQAEMSALPITTEWQKFVIPFPLASKLSEERGLFYFAEGMEAGAVQIYIDEVIFENLGTITNPRPVLSGATFDVNVGATITVGNQTVTFDVDGTDMNISAMPGYFTFASSDPGVVSVDVDGVITAVGVGTATLTADLGATAATGTITVNVASPEAEPTVEAPTPTPDPADVVSLYSDAYTPATTVDTWSAGWDNADVADFVIGSDNTKKYYNLVFAGIEFTTSPLDASAMTHFHMDVWTPSSTTAPAVFKVKLVDFGADGLYGGGDDVEHEMTFDETTMDTENWVSIDVPLADFTNLTSTGAIAQMIISGDLPTIYLDNIFFYDNGVPTEPLSPAPTPTEDAGSVVSLYSDAYTPATTVDTWSAVWDNADVADFVIGADNTKKYTNLVFAGIEFTTTPLDASAMDYFHMDVWTPNSTDAPAVYKVKLVDYGADGLFGGGDDVEHEITFDETTMNTGTWVSIDVPLSAFAGLTTTGAIAQMIISGDLSTVYVDNIYFYASTPTAPTTSAPTPSQDPADVISLYSDSYTNETMAFWSPTFGGQGWDDGTNVYNQLIGGTDNIMQFEFFGGYSVSEISPTIDASTMTYMHIDLWTADNATGKLFKIKLVDFGANGTYDGGGDDSEHELTFDDATMATGTWVSLEIPMTDFAGLTGTGHLAQIVMSGDYSNIFFDNIYFYVSAPTAPTISAPTPSYGAIDVVSLYSDAYTDVPMGYWSPTWGGQGWDDGADVYSQLIGGTDNIMQFVFFGGYSVSEISPVIDVSTMTHISLDIWTPDDPTGKNFNIKLVDFGANGTYDGGGDDSEYELTFTDATITNGSWVTLNIPLTDFTGLTGTTSMAQLVISGGYGTVFIDNVLFHK